MADGPSFIFAPRLRGGCLPFGEARGGVFALSELPHPCHVLLSRCKGNTFSFICKMHLYPKWKNRLLQGVIPLYQPAAQNIVNVEYRGLESTFGVSISSPGPPGKGSTLCHEGLRKRSAVAGLFRYTPQEESGTVGPDDVPTGTFGPGFLNCRSRGWTYGKAEVWLEVQGRGRWT